MTSAVSPKSLAIFNHIDNAPTTHQELDRLPKGKNERKRLVVRAIFF
ncbi:MAG: hypothetical protein Q8R58_10325 [Sulfuricurvum sp.]|nr:hypothetical protein [Sulfuricurvum sp.]